MPARTTTEEPRKAVRRLFRDVAAYEIPKAEERRVRASTGSPLYGEITPTSVDKLLGHLEIGADDVLYDLGSGVGKMIIQAAMTVPLRRCVGVELSEMRHEAAKRALERAREEGLVKARRCEFRNEDLLQADLSDATVVYSCSTGFSLRFMRSLTRKLSRLEEGLVFVTTQWLFTRHGFEEVDSLRLDMTWKRRSAVHIYRLRRAGENAR
jgi:hypothetical protein